MTCTLFVAASFVSSMDSEQKGVCPLVSHARQAHLIIQLFISIFALDEGEKRLTAKQVQGFCTSPQWVEKGKAPWSVRMCSPMFKHE